jgi:hypothetical protein
MKALFLSHARPTAKPRKHFVNPVDELLMRRIDEQRKRLRSAGVRITPLLRILPDSSQS